MDVIYLLALWLCCACLKNDIATVADGLIELNIDYMYVFVFVSIFEEQDEERELRSVIYIYFYFT